MRTATIEAVRGRELLGGILAGDAVDGPAIAFWKHHPVADQDGERLAEATIAFQKEVDCDLVKLGPASSYQLIDYGLRDEWIPDGIGRRTVTRRPVEKPEDWLRLLVRDPFNGFTGKMLACAKIVRRAISREIPVVATIFNPIFQTVALAGIARFLDHAESAPVELSHGLAILGENTRLLMEGFREEGVDGFYLATQHASTTAMAPWVYDRWGSPGDLVCVEAMRGTLSMMHFHGESIQLGAFPSGVEVLHYDCALSGNPSVHQVMNRFPGTVVASGLPAEGMPASRYILSCGCAVPLHVSNDELAAMAEKYRKV